MNSLLDKTSFINSGLRGDCIESKTPLSFVKEQDSVCCPDWCKKQNTIIHGMLVCGASKIYNMTSSLSQRAYAFQKIGKVEKAKALFDLLNRVNYVFGFLFLVSVQGYVNNELYTDYISDEELKCIRENLECEGIDVSCLYECYINPNYNCDELCSRYRI